MTLNELALNIQHDWLIEFTNDLSGEKKYFTPTDISPAPWRYNEFIITCEGLTGFSTYKAYEMPVMSPRSVDISLSYGICETGIVNIIDPAENIMPEFNYEENKNNGVFE